MSRRRPMRIGVDVGLTGDHPRTNWTKPMRKIVVSEFLTLDGVMQAPGDPNEDRERQLRQGRLATAVLR